MAVTAAVIFAASTAELMLRMVVSLAVVGAVVAIGLRFTHHRLSSVRSRAALGVHARCQLTRASSVAVVRAGRRYFLVGVNDNGVSLLAEGDDLIALDVEAGVERGGEGGEEHDQEGEEEADRIVDVRTKDRPRSGDRARSADAESQGGARRRHGRAGSPASPGMSVIEALRERTVRRR